MTYEEYSNLSPGDVIKYIGYGEHEIVLSHAIIDRFAYRLFVFTSSVNRIRQIRVMLNRWEVVCK
jgi:hypothetical protein